MLILELLPELPEDCEEKSVNRMRPAIRSKTKRKRNRIFL